MSRGWPPYRKGLQPSEVRTLPIGVHCSDCGSDTEITEDGTDHGKLWCAACGKPMHDTDDASNTTTQEDADALGETGESTNADVDKLEPAAYLIGEPGYAELFFNEHHFIREKTLYDSFDDVRESADEIGEFEFEPLVRMDDHRKKMLDVLAGVVSIAEDGLDPAHNLSKESALRAVIDYFDKQVEEAHNASGDQG